MDRLNISWNEEAEKQASFCNVFGNAKRVMILWSLFDHEMSVGDIASTINASLQNASQHLRNMKNYGILTTRRDGQTVYYRITDSMRKKDCLLFKKVVKLRDLENQKK